MSYDNEIQALQPCIISLTTDRVDHRFSFDFQATKTDLWHLQNAIDNDALYLNALRVRRCLCNAWDEEVVSASDLAAMIGNAVPHHDEGFLQELHNRAYSVSVDSGATAHRSPWMLDWSWSHSSDNLGKIVSRSIWVGAKAEQRVDAFIRFCDRVFKTYDLSRSTVKARPLRFSLSKEEALDKLLGCIDALSTSPLVSPLDRQTMSLRSLKTKWELESSLPSASHRPRVSL